MHAESLQSCPTLCSHTDCSPPGSSVHGILQARILEWVAMPPPGDLPNPRIKPVPPRSPALTGGFFTTSATCEAHIQAALIHNSGIQTSLKIIFFSGSKTRPDLSPFSANLTRTDKRLFMVLPYFILCSNLYISLR